MISLKNDERARGLTNLKYIKESKKKVEEEIKIAEAGLLKGLISKEEYDLVLSKKVDGKSRSEWLGFCDDYIKRHKGVYVSNVLSKSVPLIAVVLLIGLFAWLNPSPTGFVAVSESYNYTDSVDLDVSVDSNYTWVMDNVGELESFKINGRVKDSGVVKVYLVSKEDEYLVFDSNVYRNKVGLEIITGLVVSNNDSIINNSNNENPLNNNSIINDSIIDNKEIKIIKADGGGRKSVDNVFEFSFDSLFSWDVDYSKVCTKWEVNSEIVECYGSVECCAFLGMSSSGSWDSEFYLNYERYDSGLSNMVSAQIVYYDVDLSVPYSDIEYSSEEEFNADFYEFIEFSDECVSTCLLGLNDTIYKLVIEVEDSSIEIDSVRYSVEQEVSAADNKAPVLVKEIEDVYIEEKGRYSLDLTGYFNDDDALTYYSPGIEGVVVINEQKNIVSFVPYFDYTGQQEATIIAKDEYSLVESNKFTITVGEGVIKKAYNEPPELVKNISDITLGMNSEYRLDLSGYFTDEDVLKYSYYDIEDIVITFEDNIAVIKPLVNFTGNRFTYFTANDTEYSSSSNVFKISVIEGYVAVEDISGRKENTTQIMAVINEPVKWVKKIELEEVKDNVSVNITSSAIDINVKKVIDDVEIGIEDKVIVKDEGIEKNLTEFVAEQKLEYIEERIDTLNDRKKGLTSAETTEINEEIIELNNEKNSLTGYVVAREEGKGLLTRLFEWLFRSEVTGYAIVEAEHKDNTTEIIIEDSVSEIIVEYETPGPESFEKEISNNKKEVVVSSEIHYENILSYTSLPTEANKNNIRIYNIKNSLNENSLDNNNSINKNNEIERIPIDIYDYEDSDGNGLIDKVYWIVPSLSNETYEIIIEITKASHLDGNRTFIADVYDSVKARDNLSVVIPAGDYIRVVFETPLDNTKDITIYANGNSSSVEVYEVDSDVLITTFENISEEQEYKVYLTSLNGTQDTFDLRIIGNAVEFDYIVDPFSDNGSLIQYVDSCNELNTTNAVYYLNASVNNTGTCFTIAANNITLDCQGYQINYSSSSSGYGIDNSGGYDNVTIKNCIIDDASTSGNDGIYFGSVNNATIYNNTVTTASSSAEGIYLSSSNSNNITANTITTTSGTSEGLYLASSISNIIDGNTITTTCYPHCYPVSLDENSDNNIIKNNTISSNQNLAYGIYLNGADSINMTGNIISVTASVSGIYMANSADNYLDANEVNSTQLNSYYSTGGDPSYHNHTITSANLAWGKPVNYTEEAEDLTYDSIDFTQYGQVIFANSNNITITNSNFSRNGLSFLYTPNSKVSNSNFTVASGHGIFAYVSSNTSISNNSFSLTSASATNNAYRTIELSSSGNSNITDNTITTQANVGLYLTSSSNLNVLRNDIHTKSGNGADGKGIHMLSSSNSNISHNIIRTDGYPHAYAVYLQSASSNNVFDNNTVSTTSTIGLAFGFRFSGGTNNTISNSTITTVDDANSNPIYIDRATRLTVIDSTLSGNDYDIEIAGGAGWVKLINVTFNKSHVLISDPDYEMNVSWYLTVNVTTDTDGGLQNANASAWNTNNAEEFSVLTPSNGITTQTVIEYTQNSTDTVYYSFYTVNVTKSGYSNNFSNSTVNMTTNIQLDAVLNNILPGIDFAGGTVANDTYVSRDWVFVNVSVTDADPKNITFYLYNDTNTYTLFNSTTYGMVNDTSNTSINFTSLVDDVYYYNVTIIDGGASENSTETRKITVDTTDLGTWYRGGTEATNTYFNRDYVYVNVTGNDTNLISTFIDYDDSLVSWWRMDDYNSTSVSDYMNRNDGTIQGDAVYTSAGKMGGAFEFDGDGDYVDMGDPADGSLDFNNTLTISAWAYSEQTNYHTIVSKGANYYAGGYGLTLTGTPLDTIVFGVYTNGSWQQTWNDEGTSMLNRWVHVVGVYNGTDLITYLDGAEYGSALAVQEGGIGNGVKSLSIGKHLDIPTWDFNGSIDEVMFFNRSLSADEIANLYANQTANYLGVNFTSQSEGKHIYTAYSQDRAGNVNTTEERNISLDRSNPSVTAPKLNDSDFIVRKAYSIRINVTVTDAYSWIEMVNVSGKTNLTMNETPTTNIWEVNTTGTALGCTEVDSNCTLTFTAFDNVSLINDTETFDLIIDDTVPGIEFGAGTKENNTYAPFVYINVSVTETNFKNITFYLYNRSYDLINRTSYTAQTFNINISNLQDEMSYFYNVTVVDKVDYENSTGTRNITIDTTPPWNITLYDPTPANNTMSDENITLNWTTNDNLDKNLACYPTIDDVTGNLTYTVNGSFGNKSLTLVGGKHNISVTCYDDANNSNRSEIRYYTVGIINITSPLSNTIVRPEDDIIINISVLAGQDYIDNITVHIENLTDTEVLWTSNRSTEYNVTYTVTGASPRYLNVTAYGFNNDVGASVNVTSNIKLRLARTSDTTSAPLATYLCSNETYVINNSNLTIITKFDIDSLIEMVNLTVLHPNGNVDIATQISNITDENGTDDYVNYFNFSYMPNISGNYTVIADILDIDNQSVQSNITLIVSNGSYMLNLSSTSISNMSILDRCTGDILARGAYIYMRMPNISYYDLNVTMANEPERMYFYKMNISQNVTNLITYTARTNETDAPDGQRRAVLFDLEANFSFANFTMVYNYTPIWYTLTTESALNLYRCPNTSSCTWTKQSPTINTTTNTITLTRNNLSRYIITEPALSGQPSLYDPPEIWKLNTTRTYVNINNSVNITVHFNISLVLDTVTLTVNSTALTAYDTDSSGKEYWYYYNYTPSTNGSFAIEAIVYDENTFNDTASLVFYADDNITVTLSTSGGNNITIMDVNNNAELFKGPTITALTPSGQYDILVEANRTDITLQNVTINASVSVVLGFKELTELILPPSRREVFDQFVINSSLSLGNVSFVYNYSNKSNLVTDEDNIEVYVCLNEDNCNFTEIDKTIDKTNDLVSFSVPNFGNITFMIAESSGELPTAPSISELNISRTYIEPNKQNNITLSFSTNVTIGYVSVKININEVELVADTSSDLGNGNYVYNFSYTPTSTGDYNLTAVVIDSYVQNDTSTLVFYARDAETITIDAVNAVNITVKDRTSKKSIVSGIGTTVSLPPGRYAIFVEVNKTDITLNNASINDSISTVLEFKDIDDTITAPTNRVNIDQFEINSSLGLTSVDVVYNYTNLTGDIVNEDNLEIFKCNRTSACNWSEISATVDVSANTITFSVSNLSVFTVAESIRTSTVTRTVTRGGGGAAAVTQIAALEFKWPEPIDIFAEGEIKAPLVVKNKGEVLLEGIELEVEAPGLNIRLGKDKIDKLDLEEEEELMLYIKAAALEPKRYEIMVEANVAAPEFSDSAKLYIDLFEKDVAVVVKEKIVFAYDLFKENPECLELQELLDRAQTALENKEFDKAGRLTETAINGCRDLMSAEIEWYAPLKKLMGIKTEVLIAGMVIALTLVIIIYFMGKYSGGKKISYEKMMSNNSEKKPLFKKFKFSRKKKVVKKVSGREKKIRGMWEK